MINPGEIQALISLLEDNDEEVLQHVNERILFLGEEVVPYLETELFNPDQTQYEKIDALIKKIRFDSLLTHLANWKNSENQDLLEGILLLNRYAYPETDEAELRHTLMELKMKVWLELHYDLTSFEKIKIINHILYDHFKLTANHDNYHHPDNSYISKVLQTKTGNPITLSIIYMIIARMLEIPVYGVNVPQHFMLAYVDEEVTLREDTAVLFYINAFNNGVVYSHSHVRQYIETIGLKPSPDLMEPCTNLDILKRCCRNLIYAYEMLQKPLKRDDIRQLLNVLEGGVATV